MFRTLVVDDHAGYRSSLCDFLRMEYPQIEVLEAANGTDALHVIRGDGTPDLVLLDIKLGDGNGLDFTKAIKAICRSVTVIILTAYDLPQYRQAAVRNGADAFVYKGSVSCIDEIRDLLEAILSERSGRSDRR